MIYFVSCPQQALTHKLVARERSDFRRLSYPVLFARRSAAFGTYIFTDFDRLNFWQLELAALTYRELKKAGCRVLNDPARALQRLQLLRALYKAGVNSFKAWSAYEIEKVDRFPVFIRTIASHRGVIGDLLIDKQALNIAIEAAIEDGYPLSDLMIIEYRAEAEEKGFFRKRSVYRVGDVIVPSTSVFESRWTAKYGEKGIGGQDGYDEDYAEIMSNKWANDAMEAFKIACIDYGRVDFAVVGGRCEFYEINTNPTLGRATRHPFPIRLEADKYCYTTLIKAIGSLDSNEDQQRRIKLDIASWRPNRARRDMIIPGYFWTP